MEEIKEKYILKQKIKAKRIKLIDSLESNKKNKEIKYAISILNELLKDEEVTNV